MVLLPVLCMLIYGSLREAFCHDLISRKVENNILPNCGKSLAALSHHCVRSKYSKVEECCATIQEWNDGLCWCERNAFNAASNLAMDNFAFQFRAMVCNITNFMHPAIELPTARKTKLKGTCPDLESSVGGHKSERCSTEAYDIELRKQRMESLRLLSRENIGSNAEISSWHERVNAVLSPNASLFSIGMTFMFPRVNVKRYLLARTTIGNGPLWQSDIDEGTVFWKSTRIVSYASSYRLGPYALGRIEFVTFAKCSPRIEEIYVQEEESTRLLKQFVYLEPSDRTFWNTGQSAQEWCSEIQQKCSKSTFPFPDKKECVRTYTSFLQHEKVSCFHGQGSFSITALHGNTISCRKMYLDLANIDPNGFCPFLGQGGLGRCREASCIGKAYNNVFAEDNPRFESNGGYSCGNSGCKEDWPLQDNT